MDSRGTVYMKKMNKMFQKQFEHCGKNYIMFIMSRKTHFQELSVQNVTTKYTRTCREEIKKKRMGSYDRRKVCIVKRDVNVYLVRFVQIVYDKTVVTLETTGLAAYPVIAVLFNLLARSTQ